LTPCELWNAARWPGDDTRVRDENTFGIPFICTYRGNGEFGGMLFDASKNSIADGDVPALRLQLSRSHCLLPNSHRAWFLVIWCKYHTKTPFAGNIGLLLFQQDLACVQFTHCGPTDGGGRVWPGSASGKCITKCVVEIGVCRVARLGQSMASTERLSSVQSVPR
jgi:hypothetical protein